MNVFWRKASQLLAALSVLASMGALVAYAETTLEEKFLSENALAMNKMMTGMAARASGDIDRDFVDMMVPHHRGAVDMARAELRYGRNEKLRRIAQEIVVDQLQEIDAMRLAISERPATPADASDSTKSGGDPASTKETH